MEDEGEEGEEEDDGEEDVGLDAIYKDNLDVRTLNSNWPFLY